LKRLRWESDNGLVDDEEIWQSRLTSLTARVRELGDNPIVPARWDTVGTGQTYGQLWADPDTDRWQVLRDAGFVIGLSNGLVRIRIPDGWPEPVAAEQ
jgi:hypothetical protein